MAKTRGRSIGVALVVIWLAACGGRTEPVAKPTSGPTDDELIEAARQALDRKDPAAETHARELLRRHPDGWEGHQLLGLALLEQKRFDEGMVELKRALVIREDPRTHYNIALAYGMQRKFAEAIPPLETAVRLRADYPAAWAHLAMALAGVGRSDDAVASVERARASCASCEGDQAWRETLVTLAAFHADRSIGRLQTNDLAGAQADGELLLRLVPGFPDGHYNLGKVLRQRGDMAGAEREYRAAIAAYPAGEAAAAADAKNNLADTLIAAGRPPAEAVTLAREAIAARGERPSYLDTLGRACDAANDRACALDAFEKLLAAAAKETIPADVVANARERAAALSKKR